MESKPLMLIISGPAGTGKGTVVKKLIQNHSDIALSISMTTRQPRGKEQDGVEYHFASREEFMELIENDGFYEYAQYCGNFYGSPKKPVEQWLSEGKNVVLEIEVQGCEKVKKENPEAVSIFVMPPSMQELESRLRGRNTETEESIQKRLARAVEEIKKSNEYDYIIINDTVERCAEDIACIIRSEKLKPSRQKS